MLTKKNLRFIGEYIKCLNASKSAELAGYSIKTRASIGHELLRKPEIKEAIESKLKQIADDNQITKDNALTKLWHIVNNAKREADRTNAMQLIARIQGWTKEQPSQVVSIYELMKQDIPQNRTTSYNKALCKVDKSEGTKEGVGNPPAQGSVDV